MGKYQGVEYYRNYRKTEKGKEATYRAIKKYMHTEKGRITTRKVFRKAQQKPHIEAINLLGAKCVKCGFSDVRALQIDHVNGGGMKESRRLGGMYAVYKNVLLEPEKYQVLCANCNWIKRSENKEAIGRPINEANFPEAK